MNINRRSERPDDMHFCYDHWRYCEWCGRCHNEKHEFCKRNDDRRKEPSRRNKPYDMDEYDARYENRYADRYEQDSRYENRYADRYEQDDRHERHFTDCYEQNGRHEKDSRFDMDDRRKRRNRYENDGIDYEEDDRYDDDRPRKRCEPMKQKHVHEFEGSVKLAEFDEDVHNHRFAGVSGEAIKVPGGHIHKIMTRTDFFDHYHFINKFTGLQVPVDDKGNGKYGANKHVHFVEGLTSGNDGHMHQFEVATLIESPLLPEEDEDIR